MKTKTKFIFQNYVDKDNKLTAPYQRQQVNLVDGELDNQSQPPVSPPEEFCFVTTSVVA